MSFESVIAEATKSLLVPTNTGSSVSKSATPLPTVIPDMPEYQTATRAGGIALWIGFAIMLISSAVFAGLSWKVPISKRVFHVVTTLVTIIATLSYFAMALGQGKTLHRTVVVHEHKHGIPPVYHTIYRELYYARYIDWFLTLPLLLLDLTLLAGVSGGHILMTVLASMIMALSGLFSALGAEGTGQKWGWYAVACIAYLVVIWHLAIHGRAAAYARNSKVGNFFVAIAGYTIIVWTAYPVVWGVANGSRHTSAVNGEIIAYVVLDILTKPVFGLWLLWTYTRVAETNVDIGGFWTNGLSGEGRIRLDDDAA
ncbi:family A G protein-coupled receptor-like protein [Eremomyces bilateralis CBS 781.70]|uniref:Family A G protein-coupled receptor-like protein n=1 Tax=Eremomyces bilateralis CBS 781.70 TaxID=1392243 RepID=A0A6G1GHE9_9PEZI|nr:family A G protein-coupled receptor-like protein [Eremomyces bilateralis CBS 781.70]KAF1817412.1 family A G protein-coupled receptor-like protein [Eremomyces bilateralis CBS 781.70]